MFIPSGSLHSASIGYAPRKNHAKQVILQQSKRSINNFPIDNFSDFYSDFWKCHLQLIISLQGFELDASTRHLCAMNIMEMNGFAKAGLINFLTENNACKAFGCATNELESILNADNSEILSALWKQTVSKIIPTLQAILYPLKVFQDDFDIRHAVLATFRNKVLNRVLPSIDFRIPLLYRSMIFSILILTDDNSQEFIIFKKIGGSILAYEHGQKKSSAIGCNKCSDVNDVI
ncbi:unnamed protein product [Dracunculus medinensis]|uniref:Uncharacterized protein n=1 Tax=Dracunculus medinensis TaxID=318479 RepID=A0A0N4UL11_DRAME|nr:unnamed protein product [Dracunculus medinensis]